MKNVLSVDVEDYFHVEAFASTIHFNQWDSYECRVERNVMWILDLFHKYSVRGTFFILGWVAEKLPHLPRQIARAGHEIGCHGYAHQRLHRLTPYQFREDLKRATGILTDLVQRPVYCYRAPSFSIVRNTVWAFDVLAEEGYQFDSSVFPVRHDLYGMPEAARFPGWYTGSNGNRVFEFPPSTVSAGKNNFGVAGGGYLRLFPYGATQWAIQHINEIEKQPAMVYFHPWEIDPDQPVLAGSLKSSFRHYTNLRTMSAKIERLLREFQFTTLSDACAIHPAYALDSGRFSEIAKTVGAGK